MTIEKDNFIIECDSNISYIHELVNFLELRMNEIMLKLRLSKLKDKKRIIIFNDRDNYKKHIEQYFEFKDYMCADTNDGNINMLSLEEAHKCEEHKNMTLKDMEQNICHEFVHVCQQELEIESIGYDIVWFWEALATNIGNPEQFETIEIDDISKINDFNNMNNNYSIAFTIGKYMLENIDMSKIIEYIKYPQRLKEDEQIILDKSIEWSKKSKINGR